MKESDRIATITSELGALGARVEAMPDALVLAGGDRFCGGRARSHGDHRIAMAAAIAGLAADDRTEVAGWGVVRTSYPGFEQDLASLTAT